MTAALVILGVVCVGLLVALVLRERDHDRTLEAKDARHQEHVIELTARIQNPQMPPVRRTPVKRPEPPDAAAYAAVGTLSGKPQDTTDG